MVAWLIAPTWADALPTPPHARSSTAGGYKLVAGPWAVGVVNKLVLRDERRKKVVDVLVRYPQPASPRTAASWPLIVFSPAAGASGAAFPDLTAHWASHGYVVVAPTHDDAPRPGRPGPERVRFDVQQLERLADVELVLDSLDQIERKMSGFHGRRASHIDRERIGIAGHAAGALTAQMALGVKVRVSRGAGETADVKSLGDPRFKAAILISAQGTINRMLTRESWSELWKPLLVITGSKDVVAGSRETPETRQEPFLLAKPADKFLVFIEGATNASYAAGHVGTPHPVEVPVPPDDQRMITGVTASATLAFWDAYLNNDEHAREYLASDDLSRYSTGKARLKRR
jgi:predicted dienelactone hydrolase